MNGALALNLLVQRGVGDAVDGCGVAEFLEEWCLVVKSCGESECDILVECWHYAERYSRTYDALAVEVPMGEAHSVVQGEECFS